MLPGLIWCDYNYLNSYLDICQDVSKYFFVKSENGC